MDVLAIGIDDTATATKKSEGWAFIALPEKVVSQFQESVASLSEGSIFHGSKCSRKNIQKYERFLTEIRKVVSTSEPSLLAHVFDDPLWHEEFKDICNSVVKSSEVKIEPRVKKAVQYITPPLFTLQRILASENLVNNPVNVWLDESGQTQGFSSMKVEASQPISAGSFVKAIYNSYRKCKFPSAPEMVAGGINVVPDEKSILIQAADVFGNFAAAYAAWKLGATDIRQLKGEVFGRVFDNPDTSQITPSLSLQGNHLEVTLSTSGALILVIS